MNPNPKREPTLADLRVVESEHQLLGNLFLRHQEALVGGDYASALADYDEFARHLRRHIRLENDVLLPAYSEIPELPRIGKPEFFYSEHEKIESAVGDIHAIVRGLSASTSKRRIIELIEREFRLKLLLEHHEEREGETLIPIMKKRLQNFGATGD